MDSNRPSRKAFKAKNKGNQMKLSSFAFLIIIISMLFFGFKVADGWKRIEIRAHQAR